jgi:threonine synthase
MSNERNANGWLQCTACGARHAFAPVFACPICDGELSVTFDLPTASARFAAEWQRPGGLWERFGSVLPPVPEVEVVSLGEGGTPLVRSQRLAERLGLENLWFKIESSNPTGSFKDRQMAVAISVGRSWGRTRYATVSSGNVGNALSAYGAKAGFETYVWVADDTAESKRLQIGVYGANLFLVPAPGEGTMGDYFRLYTGLRAFCAERGIVPMISARAVNPFMVEGTKTIAFETVAALGRVPGDVFCCVGGGGLLGGVHKGFAELIGLGRTQAMPRIHGGQRIDRRYAPIDRLDEEPYRSGDYYRPLDGRWAWESIRATGGTLAALDGDAITRAQAELAACEGIFAEPQGAYATAALMREAEAGRLDPSATIVCIVTGIGLKDMGAAARFGAFVPERPPVRVTGLDDAPL